MTAPSFPRDEYTPYGYLDNPYDAGPWVGLEAGGAIRSLEACGFGWDQHMAGLRVGVDSSGIRLLSAESFRTADVTLVSRYHTSRMQSFDFSFKGVEVSLAFMLAARDALLGRVRLRHMQAPLLLIAQGVIQRNPRRNARAAYLADADALALMVEPGPWFAICSSRTSHGQRILEDERAVPGLEHVIGEAYSAETGSLTGELSVAPERGSDGEVQLWIALGRGGTPASAVENAKAALAEGPEIVGAREAEDERFWSRAPRPVGDWPVSWRRGWVYDLETTRLMVRQPAGIFGEIWPTWKLFQPRVVLAENSLDMLRLAYADPETAQSAILSAFRHAPKPNLPCLFANGSLNMIAQGGDACGTSPAWCLPFHNIYLLYLWHPDKAWLSAIYPHLESYLNWWMDRRRDAEGWFVYRCTWEAGEDGTLRLDPAGTGHGDIFHKVRPVELQAAMAHSALLMIRLAHELGLDKRRRDEWVALHQTYTELTRSMWDEARQRFHDLYPAEVSPVAQRERYWDAPADVSALQLIPLLYGASTPEQAAALAPQLLGFNRPPWTYWASWTYTVVEAARAIGAHSVAGKIAHDILTSVYPRLDRREDANVGARPGTSHEWWPEDLAQSSAHNETYGWGATTATLLLRHLFGFSPDPDTGRVVFELAPSLYGDLLTTGRRLGFANLHYRGASFDLELEAGAGGLLTARLTPGSPVTVFVEENEGSVAVQALSQSAVFQIHNGLRYRVILS